MYDSELGKACSQLEKAEDYFGGYDYLPLGYNVPVFFRNTAFEGEAPGSIKTAEDLGKITASSAYPYLADSEVFGRMYDIPDNRIDEDAYDSFINNAAVFYGTYTNNYFSVMTDMAARYQLYTCDVEKICCEYDNIWCANDTDKDKNKVALRFLEFMLSSNAQDEIHIQNNLHSLPINDELTEDYTSVYREMEAVFSSKDKFVFEK